MGPWKLVFLDAMTFDRQDVRFDAFTNNWACDFHPFTKPAERAERIKGHQVVVTNKIVMDEETLAAPEASGVKLIAVAATGFNCVDVNATKKRGIPVCNVKGYSSPSVAQHTFALLLELTSHAGAYSRDVAAGAWSKSPIFTLLTYPCTELAGKTLGIVGHGDIGRAVQKIAEGFGMKVLVSDRKGAKDPRPGRTPFEAVLKQADVLTLHCPLTPETQDLIGARELAQMKPSAFLINCGRGGLVAEAALIEALKARKLAGAGFDVLTQEPPPADHPMLKAAQELPNLIVTPHSAWLSVESRQRLLNEIAENIKAFEAGKERNRVA